MTAAVAALLTLLAGAGPASADPPRPTEYRSTVDAVTPAVDGVRAEVVGGDAFLELRVDEGVEVVVPGYGGEDAEPYLRFLPDGTVERNARSEATYLNEDRQGDVSLPAEADTGAEPVWEEVADDGTYAWHDHRIHWMGTSEPPGAEPGDVVQAWTVPITVDGRDVALTGELVLVDRVSPAPWLALGIAAAGVVVAVGRRRTLVPAMAVAVGAAGAVVVGWAQYSVAPPGSGANPLLVVVPLVGLVASGVGVAFRRGTAGATATLAGAAAVIGWGLLRLNVLWMPVLPTDLPANLDRAVTAVAIGLAAAGAAVVVWSGGLSFARLVPVPPEAAEPSDGPEPAGAGADEDLADDAGITGTDSGQDAADAAATRGGGEPR